VSAKQLNCRGNQLQPAREAPPVFAPVCRKKNSFLVFLRYTIPRCIHVEKQLGRAGLDRVGPNMQEIYCVNIFYVFVDCIFIFRK
jgi:hypothetical protein